MKNYLIALIVICTSITKVCAQSASAAIDSLVKFKVIKPVERRMIESDIKKYHYGPYNVAILQILRTIYIQETFHVNLHKRNQLYAFSFSKSYSTKNQDSVNASLRTLLEGINRAGLITSRVHEYAQKQIDSNHYVVNIQLMGELVEMSSRLAFLAPEKLLKVANQLHLAGIVSDSSFLLLKDDIEKDKIEYTTQLVGYCSHVKVFNMPNYSTDTKMMLEQVLHDVSSMLPGLNFTDFNVTTRPDTDVNLGNIPETRYLVSLVCNGRVYKYAANSMELRDSRGKNIPDALFANSFVRILNKILTDQQSVYRIHSLIVTPYGGGDRIHQFVLIVLHGEQIRIFMEQPCLSYIFASIEDYGNTVTSARIDSVIAGWKIMGLFAHLSDKQLAKAIDDAETADRISIDGLLTNFPNVIYTLNSALISKQPIYRNLLIHLALITHGVFTPVKISQHKIKNEVELRYTFKSRKYIFKFRTENGWLDEGFSAFVEQLGAKNSLNGNFYYLPDAGGYIYLTRQQYSYALNHQLLNFSLRRKHI